MCHFVGREPQVIIIASANEVKNKHKSNPIPTASVSRSSARSSRKGPKDGPHVPTAFTAYSVHADAVKTEQVGNIHRFMK